jgi:hypothetical protein
MVTDVARGLRSGQMMLRYQVANLQLGFCLCPEMMIVWAKARSKAEYHGGHKEFSWRGGVQVAGFSKDHYLCGFIPADRARYWWVGM